MRVLVDRRGWLQKKGRIVRNWKRRLVTLRPGEVVYFADEACTVIRGSMALSGCQVLVEEDQGPRHFCITCAARTLHLIAHDDRAALVDAGGAHHAEGDDGGGARGDEHEREQRERERGAAKDAARHDGDDYRRPDRDVLMLGVEVQL